MKNKNGGFGYPITKWPSLAEPEPHKIPASDLVESSEHIESYGANIDIMTSSLWRERNEPNMDNPTIEPYQRWAIEIDDRPFARTTTTIVHPHNIAPA